jgi:hypothetical protein
MPAVMRATKLGTKSCTAALSDIVRRCNERCGMPFGIY